MRRILVITLLASLCQGCFVFDELDKGQQIIDQHSPKARAMQEQKEQAKEAPRTARSAAQEEEEGILAALQQWWKKSREPAPPERDPDDDVVRCQIGGSTHFTRKSDCAIRGGRVI